jgi:CHAD domain-containing protein
MAHDKTAEMTSSRAGGWALRALVESDKVSRHLDPYSVNDLRVALRHCRSIADGFVLIDPDPGWSCFSRVASESRRALRIGSSGWPKRLTHSTMTCASRSSPSRLNSPLATLARALRTRSQVAFHQLRIGLKKFRYIVENSARGHLSDQASRISSLSLACFSSQATPKAWSMRASPIVNLLGSATIS